jgi:hypothetical protein
LVWPKTCRRCGVALFEHGLQAAQFWWDSVSKEGPFTREAEAGFRPWRASHYSGLTETSHAALTAHALQAMHVWNRLVTKGHLLEMPKGVLVLFSPRIAAGWLKHHTSHAVPMRYKRCKFGWNRTVVKRTLLAWPKRFFVPISPRIPAGSMKPHA